MGDVITVYGDVDFDGFYRGELAGRRGLVPSNFLRPASAADAPAQRPRHARGPPASPLPPPPTTMPDEALMSRGQPAQLTDPASYGQPPLVSPTPSGTSTQLRRPGDVPSSSTLTGPPSTHSSVPPALESRDLSMTSSPAYVGGPETADDRLRRSGQTFRR